MPFSFQLGAVSALWFIIGMLIGFIMGRRKSQLNEKLDKMITQEPEKENEDEFTIEDEEEETEDGRLDPK